MVYFIIILGIIVLDRLVKYLVSSNMTVGDTIPVVENIFHFTYIRNTGAAFSMFEGQKLVLLAIPMIVMVAGMVLLIIKRKSWHPLLNISIAFICAGGIGNFIDRIVLGYVVDMFDFRVFPVFNVADIFVCVGCGLMVLYVLVFEGKKEKSK